MNPFEFPEKIKRYADNHTSDEDPILQEVCRTTHLKTVHPQMLSGKLQGKLLQFISKMIRPKRILEIGTFTGYSAYCLARGLGDKGKLTTIEVNEELRDLLEDFFRKSDMMNKIELIIGDAMKVMPALTDSFDLIFLDANKEQYPDYYPMCIEKLNPGGFLLADNVLWGGKVAEKSIHDLSTLKLHEFNDLVTQDEGVENVFLTVRDGLMLIRKK